MTIISKKSFLFLIIGLAAVLNLPTVDAVSKTTSLRRLDDDVEEPKKRDCKISQKSDEVEFKCKAKTEGETTEIKDEIKFEVSTEDRGLVVKVEYEQEIETDDQETETETQYEIIFNRIIEYQKALGSTSLNNAYDWEDDIVISSTSLLDWGKISDIVEDAQGIVSTFTVTTTDNVASFTFSISRAAVGEAISANKMKIDFELTSFSWSQSDTYVALICDIETKRKIEVEYDDDDSGDGDDVAATGRSSGSSTKKTEDVLINFEDALDATGIIPFGEYTWAETAVAIDNTTATNTTIQVVATSPGGGSSEGGNDSGTTSIESIAFSFVGSAAQQAEDIYWDPEAGINYRSNDGSAAASLGLTAACLVAGSSAVLFALI